MSRPQAFIISPLFRLSQPPPVPFSVLFSLNPLSASDAPHGHPPRPPDTHPQPRRLESDLGVRHLPEMTFNSALARPHPPERPLPVIFLHLSSLIAARQGSSACPVCVAEPSAPPPPPPPAPFAQDITHSSGVSVRFCAKDALAEWKARPPDTPGHLHRRPASPPPHSRPRRVRAVSGRRRTSRRSSAPQRIRGQSRTPPASPPAPSRPDHPIPLLCPLPTSPAHTRKPCAVRRS